MVKCNHYYLNNLIRIIIKTINHTVNEMRSFLMFLLQLKFKSNVIEI